VQAMEQTLETLRDERNAASVDPTIAAVDHIFELVKTKEAIALEEA
jgi:phosphoenolpyruvate phosphomutase